MDSSLSQILALLVLDSDGQRLAVKYCNAAKKELWVGNKAQIVFEKKLIGKLPKPSASRSEVDVAIIDEYTVIFQACNDVIVAAVAGPEESELLVLQLMEGIYASMSNVASGSSFLSSGLTKQLVLDHLAEVFFILDEVLDDDIIMETDEEKITARIKMTDEMQKEVAAEAEQRFQKATQNAKQKLLGSLLGRG